MMGGGGGEGFPLLSLHIILIYMTPHTFIILLIRHKGL